MSGDKCQITGGISAHARAEISCPPRQINLVVCRLWPTGERSFYSAPQRRVVEMSTLTVRRACRVVLTDVSEALTTASAAASTSPDVVTSLDDVTAMTSSSPSSSSPAAAVTQQVTAEPRPPPSPPTPRHWGVRVSTRAAF